MVFFQKQWNNTTCFNQCYHFTRDGSQPVKPCHDRGWNFYFKRFWCERYPIVSSSMTWKESKWKPMGRCSVYSSPQKGLRFFHTVAVLKERFDMPAEWTWQRQEHMQHYSEGRSQTPLTHRVTVAEKRWTVMQFDLGNYTQKQVKRCKWLERIPNTFGHLDNFFWSSQLFLPDSNTLPATSCVNSPLDKSVGQHSKYKIISMWVTALNHCSFNMPDGTIATEFIPCSC